MAINITTGSTLPAATVGVFYTVNIVQSGGVGTLLWNTSPLPAGLSFTDNNTFITVDGTPTTEESPASFDVQVEELGDDFDETFKTFTLQINPAPNQALVFNQANAKVSHGSGSSLDNLPDSGAFAGWAWIYRQDTGGQQVIMAKDIAYPSGWMFLVDGATATGLVRFIIFRGSTFSNATDFRTTTLDIPNNEWTFVAFSYNSATTPRVHIYKGNLNTAVSELAYTYSNDGTGSASSDASANLAVGNDERDQPNLYFRGAIARGGVLPIAPTMAQFENIRKAGRKQLADGDVGDHVLLFDYFGTGTQTDYSGNGNTGTSSVATATLDRPDFFDITNTSLPDASVGVAYSQPINVIRGSAPFGTPTITSGTLPSGFSIAAENTSGVLNIAARISGTTSAALGSYPITIEIPDFDGNITSKSLTIEVVAAGDTTPPTVPTGLAGIVQSATRIDLSWNASTDAVGVTGYDLQRATDAGFTANLATINLGNVLTYSDTTRTANTRYYYRVRAHDAVPNNSAYSSSISRLTLPAWEGTKTFGSGGYQGIAARGTDVHVTIGQFSSAAINYWRSSDQGVTWGIDGVTIATGIPYLEDPLVVNNDGTKLAQFYFKNIVSVFDFVGERFVGELYCVVSNNGGDSWGSEELVSGVVVPGRGLRMSACWDENDRLHATWMDFKNVANPLDYSMQTTAWDLYYNRRISGTWETEQRVKASTNKTGENRPSVVALGDTIHIVWFAGIDSKPSCVIDTGTTNLPVCTEIFHSRNLSAGASGNWTTPNQLTSNNDPVLYSGRTDCLAIEPSTLLVTFDRGEEGTPNNNEYGIRSINNGVSWQTEFPISTDAGVQSHSATAHHDGKTSVIWGDRVDTALYAKESSDEGASFGVTELALAGSIVGLIDRTDDYLHLVGFVGATGTYRRRFVQPPAPDTEPPSDVGTITPTVISGSQINLDWGNASDNIGVTDYLLEVATDVNFTSIFSSGDIGSNVSARNIVNLSSSTTYYFRVKAKDAAGNYSVNWSPTASATTQSATIINVGNETAYQHTGLTSGSVHSYRVRAFDTSGNRSGWTTILTRTTS